MKNEKMQQPELTNLLWKNTWIAGLPSSPQQTVTLLSLARTVAFSSSILMEVREII